MEKAQTRGAAKKTKKEETASTRSRPTADKKAAELFPPNPQNEKIIAGLKKMSAITPYAVASRFNVRLSVARGFLKELERQGTIEYVSGSKNLKIYKPSD